MKGIESRKKRYVDVVALHREDGSVRPLSIVWEDGRRFKVERILDTRRAASLKVGGTGMRYLVRIQNKDTFLFFEDPRWFVEEVVPETSQGCAEGGAGGSEDRDDRAVRCVRNGSAAAANRRAEASGAADRGAASRAFEAIAAALKRRSHPPMPRSHARRA